MPYPIGFLIPATGHQRRAAAAGPLLVLRREPEPTAVGREVHPGQTPVELLLEEPLGLGRGGRELGQQAVHQFVDVRAHARTL